MPLPRDFLQLTANGPHTSTSMNSGSVSTHSSGFFLSRTRREEAMRRRAL